MRRVWAMLTMLLAVCFACPQALAEEKQPAKPPRVHKIRVLLVTGGHGFEHDPFLEVFTSQPDLVVQEVKQPEAQAWFAPEKADQYDVMVWYDMWQKISDETKKNLVDLLNKGKPLVAMHHSIADYQDWPEARNIIGCDYPLKATPDRPRADYTHDQKVNVKLGKHPITRYMKDFTLPSEETYHGMKNIPGLTPLLTTDNPKSNELIGWVHTYGKSPVVYLQLGHGSSSYKDPNYRRLVAQSIRWAAGQLPDDSEDGFVTLFNGKDFTNWHKMGKPEGFEVKDGIIRGESAHGGFWLRSGKQYKDFILRIEWRVAKLGNSGVFFRSMKDGYPWEPGYEVQISNESRDIMHCTGSLYGQVAADPRPDETPEMWRAYEIECRGPLVRVFLDQVPVVDVDQRDVASIKGFPLSGYIGVQDSHADTGWIEYRNIRIKELKPESHSGK